MPVLGNTHTFNPARTETRTLLTPGARRGEEASDMRDVEPKGKGGGGGGGGGGGASVSRCGGRLASYEHEQTIEYLTTMPSQRSKRTSFSRLLTLSSSSRMRFLASSSLIAG